MDSAISYTTNMRWSKTKAPLTTSLTDFCIRLTNEKPTFEFLNDNRRLYFDVDIGIGEQSINNEIALVLEEKALEYSMSAVKAVFGEKQWKYALATSHGEAVKDDTTYNKYSVRLWFPEIRGTKENLHSFIKETNRWIASIKDEYNHIYEWLGDYIDFEKGFFDDGIYDMNRKMRCIGTSKPDEDRPLVLKYGTVEDTIISIVNNAVVDMPILDEPVAGNVAVVNSDTDVQKYCDYMSLITLDNFHKYQDWYKIQRASANIGIAFEVYDEFMIKYHAHYGANSHYDKQKNREAYEQPNKSKFVLGWRYIMNLAEKCNPDAKKTLDTKYRRTITADILAKGSNDICQFMTPILFVKLRFCENAWWLCQKNNIWECIIDPTAVIVTAIQTEIDVLATNNSLRLSKARLDDDDDAVEVCVKLEANIVKFRIMVSSCSQAAMYKSLLKSYLYDKDFCSRLNTTKDKIVYKDGIWDLKEQKFEAGFKASDYISQTLDFEYKPATASDKEYVKKQIKKICNYDDTHTEYFLSILGFALTGRADEKQEFYNCTGQKACNGKSSLFEAITKIAPIYAAKVSSNAFEENNTKRHKEIAKWGGKRILWADELSARKQDTEFFKLISNGTPIPYEVMFGTTALMLVLFKLFVVSNHTLQFKMDNGLLRRLKHCQFDSVFSFDVTEDDYDKKVFVADAGFVDELATKYKFALLELLCDYAADYYKNKRPAYPADWQEEKDETMAQADPFDIWFNEHYEYIPGHAGTSVYKFKQEITRAGFKNVNPRDYFKSKSLPIKTQGKGNFYIGLALKETEKPVIVIDTSEFQE